MARGNGLLRLGEIGEPVAEHVDLAGDVLVLDGRVRDLDPQALVALEGGDRADLDGGGELDVAALLARRDLDLGDRDRIDLLGVDRLDVVLGDRVLQGLLAGDVGAEAGLEQLARRLAGTEARDADLFGELAERGVQRGLELVSRNTDVEPDFVAIKGLYGGLHGLGSVPAGSSRSRTGWRWRRSARPLVPPRTIVSMSNETRRHPTLHRERHRGDRTGWLRAAVLGANDGIVSTASLLIGVAAAAGSRNALITAGAAGLVAGASSMAMGEYVSVSSQRDTEEADIAKEEGELAKTPELELTELTRIYERRGLDHETAVEVAEQLTAHDPLGAHLRDELGLHDSVRARPLQAAGVSSVSFAFGALFPFVAIFFLPTSTGARVAIIAVIAFVALAISGALSGRIGGASVARGATRVLVGGGLAMVASALIGTLVGAAV